MGVSLFIFYISLPLEFIPQMSSDARDLLREAKRKRARCTEAVSTGIVAGYEDASSSEETDKPLRGALKKPGYVRKGPAKRLRFAEDLVQVHEIPMDCEHETNLIPLGVQKDWIFKILGGEIESEYEVTEPEDVLREIDEQLDPPKTDTPSPSVEHSPEPECSTPVPSNTASWVAETIVTKDVTPGLSFFLAREKLRKANEPFEKINSIKKSTSAVVISERFDKIDELEAAFKQFETEIADAEQSSKAQRATDSFRYYSQQLEKQLNHVKLNLNVDQLKTAVEGLEGADEVDEETTPILMIPAADLNALDNEIIADESWRRRG